MAENPYLDTSLLVKLYATEINSQEADAVVLGLGTPLPLTPLQTLEFRTALRLKQGRGELSAGAVLAAENDFQSDLEAGRYHQPAFHFRAVFERAENLSVQYAASTMCRTLDILHVASALTIGCGEFASFDQRQRTLAAEAGLAVLPLA